MIIRTIQNNKIYVETQCEKKKHGQQQEQTIHYEQRGEYNVITITTNDFIKQQDYNLFYNFSLTNQRKWN